MALVKYKCGHTEEQRVYGSVESAQRYIAWLEKNHLCHDCYAALKAKEREEAAAEEAKKKFDAPPLLPKKPRKKNDTTTIHIGYSPDELKRLDKLCEKVGMSRPAYLKTMGFDGKVKGYNLKAMEDFASAVGEVAAEIRKATSEPHPDRWAYEADIETIDEKLDQLIDMTSGVMETIIRRMKR